MTTPDERLNLLTRRVNELTSQVRRMSPGKVVARSAIPQAVPPRPGATVHRATVESASWSSDGDVSVSTPSDVYEVLLGGQSVTVIVNLSATLTGDTDVDVLLNGSSIGTATVTSGQTRGSVDISQVTVPGDVVTLNTTAVGTGSARASAQLKITQ